MRNHDSLFGAGRFAALAALALAALAAGSGCAQLAFSSDEQTLLDQAAAEARYMDAHWASRSAADRADFVRQNALRWQYFADLVHGRRPAATTTGGDQ